MDANEAGSLVTMMEKGFGDCHAVTRAAVSEMLEQFTYATAYGVIQRYAQGQARPDVEMLRLQIAQEEGRRAGRVGPERGGKRRR